MGFTLGSLAELQLLRGDLDAAAATVEEMLTLSAALTHAELTCITSTCMASSTWAAATPPYAQERLQEMLPALPPDGISAPIG